METTSDDEGTTTTNEPGTNTGDNSSNEFGSLIANLLPVIFVVAGILLCLVFGAVCLRNHKARKAQNIEQSRAEMDVNGAKRGNINYNNNPNVNNNNHLGATINNINPQDIEPSGEGRPSRYSYVDPYALALQGSNDDVTTLTAGGVGVSNMAQYGTSQVGERAGGADHAIQMVAVASLMANHNNNNNGNNNNGNNNNDNNDNNNNNNDMAMGGTQIQYLDDDGGVSDPNGEQWATPESPALPESGVVVQAYGQSPMGHDQQQQEQLQEQQLQNPFESQFRALPSSSIHANVVLPNNSNDLMNPFEALEEATSAVESPVPKIKHAEGGNGDGNGDNSQRDILYQSDEGQT